MAGMSLTATVTAPQEKNEGSRVPKGTAQESELSKMVLAGAVQSPGTVTGAVTVVEKAAFFENLRPKLSIPSTPSRLRLLLPPVNFGAVENGRIYRSAYPTVDNYDFISSLRINTIITLVPEPLEEHYMDFLINKPIRHHQVHIPANKDGIINITPERMNQVLAIVLNRNSHPILVHCNRGKHRTGCVTACLRKVQSYPVEDAVAEYRDYASPKCRADDETFIESFDASALRATAGALEWLQTPPYESAKPLPKKDSALSFEEIASISLPESL